MAAMRRVNGHVERLALAALIVHRAAADVCLNDCSITIGGSKLSSCQD